MNTYLYVSCQRKFYINYFILVLCGFVIFIILLKLKAVACSDFVLKGVSNLSILQNIISIKTVNY